MNKIFTRFAATIAALLFIGNFGFAHDYTDLDQSHWAYNYIQMLTDEGVVVGYPDGSFRPNEYVTRAEFASMAINGLKMQTYTVKEPVLFSDVPFDYWAYEQIQRAAYFDLIDSNQRNFNPDGTVTRAHAMSVVVNALTTEELSDEKAREILKAFYTDYYTVTSKYIVVAGKAHLLGLVVTLPDKENIIAADMPATRAELCAFLFKMMEAAKLNPNKKIADAMPKYAEGIVIDSATVEGNIATIPAGTLLPVSIVQPISTQKNAVGQEFVAKITDNLVTKQKYLMLKKDDPVAGRILDVKKGYPIIRNGSFNLETKDIKTHNDQVSTFPAIADLKLEYKWFWKKFLNLIFKNGKIELKENDSINVKLMKPMKIDVGSGWIIE